MTKTYIPRSLEPVLKKAVSQFPVVVLVGPRQSGKTTLLRHLYGDQYPIVSLEPPDVRIAALNDPRGFLNLYPPPVVFDEMPPFCCLTSRSRWTPTGSVMANIS
jgi:predicted AAA+ superfamily ATPase